MALLERFSLGMKWTGSMGSMVRADTNHFYNCLQQERKHELNSSVVDRFGGETGMNCQQDGCLLLSWDLLLFPAIWPPCAEPRDLQTFLQVWASLCGVVPGAGPACVEENLSGVLGKRARSVGGRGTSPTPLLLGQGRNPNREPRPD